MVCSFTLSWVCPPGWLSELMVLLFPRAPGPPPFRFDGTGRPGCLTGVGLTIEPDMGQEPKGTHSCHSPGVKAMQ